MLEVNNFFHGTRIVEGYGVLNETGNEVKTLGFKKVLIVTDDFLSKSTHYQVLKEARIKTLIFQYYHMYLNDFEDKQYTCNQAISFEVFPFALQFVFQYFYY